jgi:hypothetical protein
MLLIAHLCRNARDSSTRTEHAPESLLLATSQAEYATDVPLTVRTPCTRSTPRRLRRATFCPRAEDT